MEKATVGEVRRAGRANTRIKSVRVTHLRYEVWKATKVRAALEDRPLVELISDALVEYLAKHARVDGTGRRAQNGEKRRATGGRYVEG